jgi:hypothetical protein
LFRDANPRNLLNTHDSSNMFYNVVVYKDIIQGVSEFDRQTFRAHSTIKNKHKTVYTYWVKNAYLRDNQQKRKNNYDLNSLDFMGLSVH